MKLNHSVVDMVKKELTFKDGTRIFYEEKQGRTQRFIEFPYNPQELKMIKENPILKRFFDSKVRKFNAGKYYYLPKLYDIACDLNETQRIQLYGELKELHDKVGKEYDPNIKCKGFLLTCGEYFEGNIAQCTAFFMTIYLAMLDLEVNKEQYPHSLGKTMVLRSCEAVILKNTNPEEAAVMFEKKHKYNFENDDAYYSSETDSRYEKYNGYNGYDDDTIDIGFDGYPEATWNVN